MIKDFALVILLKKLKKRVLKAIQHSAKEKAVWNGEVVTSMAQALKEALKEVS